MPNLTIKNIPPDLYEMLKQQARTNHRSINSEIIFTLKKVVGFREETEVEEVIKQAREVRNRISVALTDEEINQAKRSGLK